MRIDLKKPNRKLCFIIIAAVYCLTTNKIFCQDYKPLKEELSNIYVSDQKYRIIIDSLVRKQHYDWQHPEIQKIIPIAAKEDSLNLARVISIINAHGWLGTNQVGAKGNETLFVVIQHADSMTIVQYFPLLVKSYEVG